MTEVERFRKLKLELEDVAGKLVGLPQRIDSLRTESATARDEAVRMELLGDSGAGGKRAGIKAAQDEVRKIEAEREDLLHRRGILLSVLEDVKKKAEPELAAIHTRQFLKAARVFASAALAAHKAELELAAIKEEAAQAFGEIDSRNVPLPSWAPVLLRDLGSSGLMRSELVNFFDSLKAAGFDLS